MQDNHSIGVLTRRSKEFIIGVIRILLIFIYSFVSSNFLTEILNSIACTLVKLKRFLYSIYTI